METQRPTISADSPDFAAASVAPVDEAPAHHADDDIVSGMASVSPAEAMDLSLTPPQRTAIQMLTSGKTAIDSALAAGVSRRTLYRWLKTDVNFQAAYNAWQHDAIATARGKVLALTDAAIDAVRRALVKGDAKTALVILKSTGILDRPEPGSTDPEEVQARQAIAGERAEANLFFDKLEANFPE
jgi:hypothetical protein